VRPARQGSLDGLCGVYAVINATSLALGLKRRSALQKDLFVQLTHGLGACALLAAMDGGLDTQELVQASKAAFAWLEHEHGVRLAISQPYKTAKGWKISKFTDALRELLSAADMGVILQVRLPNAHHWTVPYAISGRRLMLRDSEGLSALILSEFSIGRGSKRFIPVDTLIVRRLS